MTPRYAVNTDTDHIWAEICDTTAPHVNGVGVPIARAWNLELATRLCELMNADPQTARQPVLD